MANVEIKFKEPIGPSDPIHVIYPITVGPQEYVNVYSGTSNVTFQAFGFEINTSDESMGNQKRLGVQVGDGETYLTLYSAPLGYEAILKVVVTYTSSSATDNYDIWVCKSYE